MVSGALIVLSATDKETVLRLASEGKSIREIREAIGFNSVTFSRVLVRDPEFRALFEEARARGWDEVAEQLPTLADNALDMVELGRAKMKVDTIRWLLSKRVPKVYGDSPDSAGASDVPDLRKAIRERATRGALATYSLPNLPATIAIPQLEPVAPSDSESIDSDDIFGAPLPGIPKEKGSGSP